MSRLARGWGKYKRGRQKESHVSVWSISLLFFLTKISLNVHKSIERAVDIFVRLFSSLRNLFALRQSRKFKEIKNEIKRNFKLKGTHSLKYGDNIKFIIWVRNQNMKIFCFAFCWTWKMLKRGKEWRDCRTTFKFFFARFYLRTKMNFCCSDLHLLWLSDNLSNFLHVQKFKSQTCSIPVYLLHILFCDFKLNKSTNFENILR